MFSGLCFSRNYGHQSAILAGMMTARQHADMVITIDADLQQDIEALDDFCEMLSGRLWKLFMELEMIAIQMDFFF